MGSCTKQFTLHIEPSVGCYTDETTIPFVGGAGYGTSAYGATGAGLNPNRIFASGQDDRLFVADADTDAYLTTQNYGTGDQFREMAFSTLNDRLYVSTWGLGFAPSYYRCINAQTLATIGTIGALSNNSPGSLIYSPDKQKVFAIQAGTGAHGSLHAIDVLTNGLVATALGGVGGEVAYAVCYRPSVDRLYVLTFGIPGYVRVLNGTTYADLGKIASGLIGSYSPAGICYASSTDRLYVVMNKNSIPTTADIYCINPDTGLVEFSQNLGLNQTMIEHVITYDSARDYVVWVNESLGQITAYALSPTTNTIDCTYGPYAGAGSGLQTSFGNNKLFIPAGSVIIRG